MKNVLISVRQLISIRIEPHFSSEASIWR